MRAAVQKRFGAPEVLSVREVEPPRAGENEVLIQIGASSVTQGDRRLRAADFPGISAVVGRLMFGVLSPRNPIGGTTFAGRVLQVGAGVTRFAPGDQVFGSCDHSAYAESISLPQDGALAKMPEGVSDEDASAVPYGAGTALTFLRDMAKVQAGEKVLIIGASGGVGRFAVQLARHFGAQVTGVCSDSKRDLVKGLGAHKTLSYSEDAYLNGDEHYDVIFDTHFANGFERAKPALTDTGRYLTLYVTVRVLWQMLLAVFRAGPKPRAGVALPSQALMSDVAQLLRSGVIRPVVTHRYPLSRIAEAHDALETKDPNGAVVVTMGEAA